MIVELFDKKFTDDNISNPKPPLKLSCESNLCQRLSCQPFLVSSFFSKNQKHGEKKPTKAYLKKTSKHPYIHTPLKRQQQANKTN